MAKATRKYMSEYVEYIQCRSINGYVIASRSGLTEPLTNYVGSYATMFEKHEIALMGIATLILDEYDEVRVVELTAPNAGTVIMTRK